MTVGSFVLAVLVISALIMLVQYVVPEPPKKIVQIILAVVLVIWLLAGFFPGLASHRIP